MSVQISIILSVYNGSKYVHQAVQSILEQTFRDFELIIIDDGSTDDTLNKLSKFSNDHRVRLIHQNNLGLTLSLIRGISISRAEYIARQDADDISTPNRLAVQLEFLQSNPDYALVGSFADILDGQSNYLKTEELPIDNIQVKKVLTAQNCFFHGSVLMKKTIYNSVGGYRPEFLLAQDYDLWLRIAERYLVGNIPQPLYCYRINNDGLSIQRKIEQQFYIWLAQKLATERQNVGIDMLLQGNNNLEKFRNIFIEERLNEKAS